MARSGAKRRVGPGPSTGSEETRRMLVAATIEALREEGFSGTSAREIARRAGCNQGLVFYHFGSVTNLLLAALDEVSALRLTRYQACRRRGPRPDRARRHGGIDLRGGPRRGVHGRAGRDDRRRRRRRRDSDAEVAARIAPWRSFAADAVHDTLEATPLSALLAPEELAHAIVALYLGLEMLAHLDGDRAPAIALFERAETARRAARCAGRRLGAE